MRWFLSLPAVVGLGLALPIATPGTAHACSCAYSQNGPQIIEHVSRAASVFTGIATAERVDGQTAFYEFDVREVFEGDIGTTTVVSSSVQSSACGRGFDIGTEYLVFTTTYDTHGAPWSVNACSATTESVNDRTRDAAVTVYGEPRSADPATDDVGIDDARRPLWWGLAAAAGVAVVAVAIYRRPKGTERE